MKVLFITPSIGAWATHGLHRAPNQMYAQLAAYIREKNIAEPEVIDCRALDLSFSDLEKEIQKIKSHPWVKIIEEETE